VNKVLPTLVFLACLVASILLFYIVPVVEIVPYPLSMSGVLLIVAGITLLVIADLLFQRVGTNIDPFLKPDKLVIHGPFSYTRNPMYLGFLLTLLGVCILLGALSPFVALIIFFLIVDYWYIPLEESMCEEEFGQDYQDYKRRVRRWL
jgi:protein-S-isoprenylcysteine O-methyltransferase Ste14